MQVGEGNEVALLFSGVGQCEGVESVSDLLDLNGAGEGRLLGIVSLEL